MLNIARTVETDTIVDSDSFAGYDTHPKSNVDVETVRFGLMQRTIAAEIPFQGIAVHSGQPVTMVVKSARAGSGIVFVTDSGTSIPATITHICENAVGLSTLIGVGSEVISTIEHLMAAFAACGVDNAQVHLKGSELPIMDGSAKPYIDEILRVGLVAQQAARKFLRITKAFTFEGDDGEWVHFAPITDGEEGRLVVTIDFSEKIPAIGKQVLDMSLQPLHLRQQIMHCRTFGLEAERLAAQSRGRGLGASCDNVVFYDGDTVLNPDGLRCADESVRHKALDLIGDLYLAGWPVDGHISAFKPSHRINAEALQALLRSDCVSL